MAPSHAAANRHLRDLTYALEKPLGSGAKNPSRCRALGPFSKAVKPIARPCLAAKKAKLFR